MIIKQQNVPVTAGSFLRLTAESPATRRPAGGQSVLLRSAIMDNNEDLTQKQIVYSRTHSDLAINN